MKAREDRQIVSIPARMKNEAAWQDVAIRNVSSHGVMISLPDPPKRGTYVEIRRGALIIIGCVKWSRSGACGLRTHEKLSVPALGELMAAQPGVRPSASAGPERRRRPRRPEELAEHAVVVGRRMQFIAMGAACTAAVVALAFITYHWLAEPLDKVAAALT